MFVSHISFEHDLQYAMFASCQHPHAFLITRRVNMAHAKVPCVPLTMPTAMLLSGANLGGHKCIA